tara:strand:- start:45 stop:311 length:267 start_codon:yes stop_codon:yes gene_type:complete
MKKLVLFLLLSVVAVESGYAFIFGGGAWRRHYRRHRRGLLSCVEKQAVGPVALQAVRDAVDEQLEDKEFLEAFNAYEPEAASGGQVWR